MLSEGMAADLRSVAARIDEPEAATALEAAADALEELSASQDAASRYAGVLCAELNETRRALHRLCAQIERLGEDPHVAPALRDAAGLAYISGTDVRHLPPADL